MNRWLLAIRPRTLTGAVAPVLVGLSSAYQATGFIRPVPALLCLLFALLMQVNANLFNDWWDCRKGVDTDVPRIGPLRVCAAGLVSMRAMLAAIVLVTLLAAAVGLGILWWSAQLSSPMPFGLSAPLLMLLVGICCLVGFAAYSTFFSRWALGDVMVVVFFGLVPVVCTYLLQDAPSDNTLLWNRSLAMGLAADALLVVNNYRDRHGDRLVGKRTLCTLIGTRASEMLYFLLGVAAVVLSVDWRHIGDVHVLAASAILLLPYLALHNATYRKMVRISEGPELNSVLADTARNILILGLCVSLLSIMPG